jgi:hypothetical protein
MAKRPTTTSYQETETEEHVNPVVATRRRIQVRRPEEMAGLTVSLLVPNCYLKALMQAYFEDANATRQGRKLPEATMVRRILIKGLAEITGDSEEDVTDAMAAAEADEAESIARHREAHGL